MESKEVEPMEWDQCHVVVAVDFVVVVAVVVDFEAASWSPAAAETAVEAVVAVVSKAVVLVAPSAVSELTAVEVVAVVLVVVVVVVVVAVVVVLDDPSAVAESTSDEVVAEISLAYQTLHPPSPQCALKVEEFWL